MINKEQIRDITEKCKIKGAEIKVTDIAFVYLCRHFSDADVAYRALFGKEATQKEVELYSKSKGIDILRQVLNEMDGRGRDEEFILTQDITFEQNKEALIKMLDKIPEAVNDGTLTMKDAMKMEKDIRVALNDKFGTAEESAQQFVFVEAKFNHICEWTHRECFLQTKDYAKKQWGLVEKNELIKELKNEYDLIPKQK